MSAANAGTAMPLRGLPRPTPVIYHVPARLAAAAARSSAGARSACGSRSANPCAMTGNTWLATAARCIARLRHTIVPNISDTSAGLHPAASAMASRVTCVYPTSQARRTAAASISSCRARRLMRVRVTRRHRARQQWRHTRSGRAGCPRASGSSHDVRS